MCTDKLPFNRKGSDECKYEVLNKRTPELPEKFKEYSNLLEK